VNTLVACRKSDRYLPDVKVSRKFLYRSILKVIRNLSSALIAAVYVTVLFHRALRLFLELLLQQRLTSRHCAPGIYNTLSQIRACSDDLAVLGNVD